jgi:hypothetical protein
MFYEMLLLCRFPYADVLKHVYFVGTDFYPMVTHTRSSHFWVQV